MTERCEKKVKERVKFHMVYSIHPCLSLHLPQYNSQTEHPVSFSAPRSSSQCHFLRRRRPWPARGAKELLSAARGREDTSIRSEWRRATRARPSEVSHFLTLAWQRDQGQTLATWLPKHPSGFPEKSNCTDCLKPEARTANSSA